MAGLPRRWREILESVDFRRESNVRHGFGELPDESALRPVLERLATKWSGRVHPSSPAGPLVQFSRERKVAPGSTVVSVRRFELGHFVVVVEVERLDSDNDDTVVRAIEYCSLEHLYDVLDAMFHDLEGTPKLCELAGGWATLDRPGEPSAKFWRETEEVWRDRPSPEGLAALSSEVRERRAWRLMCRVVPAAMSLYPCPCIQNLGQLFQGDWTCQDPVWAGAANRFGEAAMSRCTLASQNCVSLQLWMVMSIAPVRPATLLDTMFSLMRQVPEWLEARRGRDATLPTRVTFEEVIRSSFHDVIGNPFAPVAAEPHWLAVNDQAVERLARQIDKGGQYNMLGHLGDALQDAGCDNERILAHCREANIHGPGCWIIDTLLGRYHARN